MKSPCRIGANAHLLLIIYDATSLEEVGRLEAPVP
jgi:hypothetical protein